MSATTQPFTRAYSKAYLKGLGAVKVEVVLTVPDAYPDATQQGKEYTFAGVPDGLGAFKREAQSFDLLVTHEIFYNQGRERTHARSGAFVSRWVIDTSQWNKGEGSLSVLTGQDQIQQVHYWDYFRGEFGNKPYVPLERLCSADLPAPSALRYEEGDTVYGTKDRIFLGGEEQHTRYKPQHGRALAHILTGKRNGQTYELPRLGRLAFENIVACPYSQRKTIAVCLDDATDYTGTEYQHRNPPSELYVYIGDKQEAAAKPTNSDEEQGAPPHELAGFTEGQLFGVKLRRSTGEPIRWEDREMGFGGDRDNPEYAAVAEFTLYPLGDRSVDPPIDPPGVTLQKDSISNGIAQWMRLEDGCWDPRAGFQHQFYFVTTDDYGGNSRLFRLCFDDIMKPETGGTVEILLSARDASPAIFQCLDSVTVDPWGRVFLQEDPGKEEAATRTLMYLPDTEKLYVVAVGVDDVFVNSESPSFLTHNEEAAGIIPVFDILGEGWYLTAVQANISSGRRWPETFWTLPGEFEEEKKRLEADLVTPGQILAIYVPEGIESSLTACNA